MQHVRCGTIRVIGLSLLGGSRRHQAIVCRMAPEVRYVGGVSPLVVSTAGTERDGTIEVRERAYRGQSRQD